MFIDKKPPRRYFDSKNILYNKNCNQYHWDTTNSDTFNFIGNIRFNWTEFLNKVLDLVDKMPGPNIYYWGTANNVFVADKNITTDLAATETRYQVDTGYNQYNTQIYRFVNEDLNPYFQELSNFFPEINKNKMIRVLVQMPGQIIPTHVDTFVTYRNLYPDADLTKIKRYCAFVSDWHWGHFFHYGTGMLESWKAGDYFAIDTTTPHGSANAGFLPKVTIQWDGMVD